MDCNFHDLPPHKRFKLTQQHHRQEIPCSAAQISSSSSTPLSSCLPAKKRKQVMEGSGSDSDSLPFPAQISTASFCLPAKKRIWALLPFDLNQEYEPTDEKPPQIEDAEPVEDNESKEDVNNNDDDDGIVCAVCGSTDGDPTDPIVLCDGCDLMVHAACYGNPFTKEGIPEGDWFCAQCSASKESTQVSCCLCPNPGGALKPTVDGKWAHLVCAVYVPEVYFEDWEGREGIDCSKVLERRWKGECYVCRAISNGCVVDCSEPRCRLRFHVSCGVKEELCIEYSQGSCKGGGGVVAAFCKSHTDLWKKQEQTGKFKIVAREEDGKK